MVRQEFLSKIVNYVDNKIGLNAVVKNIAENKQEKVVIPLCEAEKVKNDFPGADQTLF